MAANVAELGQDIELRRKLLANGGRLLVEAASSHRVWAGYTVNDQTSHRQHWGKSRPGEALIEAREELWDEGEAAEGEENR